MDFIILNVCKLEDLARLKLLLGGRIFILKSARPLPAMGWTVLGGTGYMCQAGLVVLLIAPSTPHAGTGRLGQMV